MQILAHRGLWTESSEKNTMRSFRMALDKGFGIETDVRDLGSQLVISHEVPTCRAPRLVDLFELYRGYNSKACLAINIKSCGLASSINALLKSYGIPHYFCFDMAVPDTLDYLKTGLCVLARRSEFELENTVFEGSVSGVWWDDFYGQNTLTQATASVYLESDKVLAIVSPELHNRPYKGVWASYCTFECLKSPKLYLCTDFPKEAQQFFKEAIDT